MGFHLASYAQEDNIFGEKRWQALLYNKQFSTFAAAIAPALPAPGNQATIYFYTFLEDGVLLLTLNGLSHGIIGKMPATILQDSYAVTVEEQWQTHQTKLKELARPRSLSVEGFRELYESHQAAYINSLSVAKQITRRPGTDLFDLTIVTAMKTAIALTQGNRKYIALLKKRATKASTTPNIEIPIEAEIDAYHLLDSYEQRPTRRNFKLWVLLGTLILFILSFTTFIPSETLLILIGVLLLHELGHWLAMRIFGYQNTSIFFLPFFGAAASGRKEDATVTEKVIVLLAGPLPGLLLGVALGIAMQNSGNFYYNPTAFSGVGFLIILNLINLLPILPLDGGKVVNLLLFSHHPFTDVLFKISTVAILLFVSFTLKDPITFPLGIIIALTIPASFRSAKVMQKLRQQRLHHGQDIKSLLPAIFQAIRQTDGKALPFSQKYRLAKDIAQRCLESRASWTTRLSLLGVYGLSLIGGLVLSVLAFVPLERIFSFSS